MEAQLQAHKTCCSIHASSTLRSSCHRSYAVSHSVVQRRFVRCPSLPDEDTKPQSKPEQQPSRSRLQDTEVSLPAWVQRKWEQLDTPQKCYAVVVCIAVLGVLPRILTLLVLGLERVIIGGLLAAEEALLELLFRGGALVRFAPGFKTACLNQKHGPSGRASNELASAIHSNSWTDCQTSPGRLSDNVRADLLPSGNHSERRAMLACRLEQLVQSASF